MQPIFSSALFFIYQNYAPTLHHLVSSRQDFKLLSVIAIEATISKFLESLKLYHNYNCGYISHISSRFSAISKFLGSLKPKSRQQFKSLLLISFQFVFKHCCNVFLLFAFLSHYFVGMSSWSWWGSNWDSGIWWGLWLPLPKPIGSKNTRSLTWESFSGKWVA